LARRAESRQLLVAPDQRRSDAAAELDGHVAAVRDRNEDDPRVALPVDAKAAECEAAHDAPGHDHLDADPKAHLHIDAPTAQRACRQQDEDVMVARFCASGRLDAERQDRALSRPEQCVCGHDPEPRPCGRLAAERSPLNVDHDPLFTVVPQLDRSRARRRKFESCG
jgi:hypothetical protein